MRCLIRKGVSFATRYSLLAGCEIGFRAGLLTVITRANALVACVFSFVPGSPLQAKYNS